MAKQLRRPTKEMMQAVNAAIGGNKKKVNELVKEHRLSRRELEARLEIRDGEKYDLAWKGGRPKGSAKKKTGREAAAGRWLRQRHGALATMSRASATWSTAMNCPSTASYSTRNSTRPLNTSSRSAPVRSKLNV